MTVGREIRHIREAKGWSQAKLAAAADTSVSAVSQIETGGRNPSAVTLEKMAEALDVGVADFFPKAEAPSLLDAEASHLASEAGLTPVGKSLPLLWNVEIIAREVTDLVLERSRRGEDESAIKAKVVQLLQRKSA